MRREKKRKTKNDEEREREREETELFVMTMAAVANKGRHSSASGAPPHVTATLFSPRLRIRRKCPKVRRVVTEEGSFCQAAAGGERRAAGGGRMAHADV